MSRGASTAGTVLSGAAGLALALATLDGVLAALRGAGAMGGLVTAGAAAALLVPPALVAGGAIGGLSALALGPPPLAARAAALFAAPPGDPRTRAIFGGLLALALFVLLHRAATGAIDAAVRSVTFRALASVLVAFGAGALAGLAGLAVVRRVPSPRLRPARLLVGAIGAVLALAAAPLVLAPSFAEALGTDRLLPPMAALAGVSAGAWLAARRGARAPIAVAVVAALLGAPALADPEARASVVWSTASARLLLPLVARGGALAAAPEPPPEPFAPAAPARLVARRPIVLLSLDAVGADHLPVYGYARPTAPRLSAWSKGAVVFDAAMAPGPVTRLSVPSLFVGLHPSQVAMTRRTGATQAERLADTTLAERLRDAGYRTVAIPGGRYFVGFRGLTQGFDVVDRTAANETRRLETRGAIVTDRARRALEEARTRPEPTFLWIHYDDAHAPHSAIEGAPRFGRREIDRYDQEIWWVDRQLAELLPAVERALGDRDPLIVVTADHGERFGPGGRARDRAQALEPGTLWVPLVVKVRGVAPRRVRGAVSLLDLVPTILDLVGVAPRGVRFEGRSLVPELLGRRDDRARVVFSELDQAGPRLLDAVAARDARRLVLVDRLRGAGRFHALGRGVPSRATAHLPGDLAARVEAHVSRLLTGKEAPGLGAGGRLR